MPSHDTVRLLFVALAAILLTSCRTPRDEHPVLVQPGAPGEATRVITAREAVDLSVLRPSAADIRFMQGMIGHHAQALAMTTLLPSRTSHEDMRLLAQRIELSQAGEIAAMQRWLRARDQAVPDLDVHHGHGELMPGMLTPGEMARLEAATGTEFDRLFLESMIRHHDGALTMVEALFDAEGAGQDPEIFAFAADVDADQRIEIARMSAMLQEMLK